MARVLGLGGVVLRAARVAETRDWYARVLGLEMQDWGGAMFRPLEQGVVTFSLFDASTPYFDPSTASAMINFVVDDLDGVLSRAAGEGVAPLAREDADPNGRFAWLLDPEGVKVELWEPRP